jgi:hypothetical protein
VIEMGVGGCSLAVLINFFKNYVMPNQTLGRIIPVKVANEEINRFLRVRESTYNSIQNAVQNLGPSAVTYHSDVENSFTFDMESLKKLFDIVGEEKFNGLRVYYAAAHKNEEINGKPRTVGSTTVVLVPCKITYAETGEVLKIENVIVDIEQAAVEYPGGNKKEDLTANVDIHENGLGDPVAPREIMFFF